MSEKRPYHHGDLRDAILERAARIIGDQGIEALSLRAVARDLAVSHGAPNRHFKTKSELLAALAAKAWYSAQQTTLNAAEAVETDNPHIRLNAMGRGFLKWALDQPALFNVLLHPDVSRYGHDELQEARAKFQQTLKQVVVETQQHGRHPETNSALLALYTNSVPFGLAALLRQNDTGFEGLTQDEFIAELIELVVPVRQFER